MEILYQELLIYILYRKFTSSVDSDVSNVTSNSSQQIDQLLKEINGDGDFLKLSRTQEWVFGEKSDPINRKVTAKLKREILLVSVGVGLACSGYCLITSSMQLVPAMFGMFVYKAAVLVQV